MVSFKSFKSDSYLNVILFGIYVVLQSKNVAPSSDFYPLSRRSEVDLGLRIVFVDDQYVVVLVPFVSICLESVDLQPEILDISLSLEIPAVDVLLKLYRFVPVGDRT